MTAGVYLAFDFGTKRIGVAIGDAVTRAARGLGAVPQDWQRIGQLLAEWAPAACIVGLPLGEAGEEQAITRQARQFAQQLQQHFGGPVHLCDERYSSRSARGDLRGARADGLLKRRVRAGDKDSAAARIILEQWLAENPGEQRTSA
ncbi:MAG: Holliday junction resolvase RuvX [Arenimonas sp.]